MNGPAKTNVDLEELIGELAEQFAERLQNGERPDVEQYARDYPEAADALRQILPALVVMGTASSTDSAGEQASHHSLRHDLGDFRILREIGRGGMGVVYEAEQLSLGRRMALKVLPFAAMLDKQQLKRFKNEARAAATLDHPNIVAVHSVGEERGVHYYAMQLVEGQSLAEVIAARRGDGGRGTGDGELYAAGGEDLTVEHHPQRANRNPSSAGTPIPVPRPPTPVPLPPPDTKPVAALSTLPEGNTQEYFRTVARLGIQAAQALDHAHQNGIVHRDVKPGNLLIDTEGKLYVTDFGLARIETDAAMTMTGDLLGTLRYMSPEQAAGKAALVDYRTDIHALGATLYELLALRPAFVGDDRALLLRRVAEEMPMPLRQVDPRIPPDLETITAKCLEKEPADRYQSAGVLASDLRAFLEHRAITAKPPNLLQRSAKWARRHSKVAWSIAAFALLSSILATWLVTKTTVERRAISALVETILHQADEAIADNQLKLAQSAVSKAERQAAELGDSSSPLRERITLLSEELARYETFAALYQDARWKRSYAADVAASALAVYAVLDDADWTEPLREAKLPAPFVERVEEEVYELLVMLAHESVLWCEHLPKEQRPARIARSEDLLTRAIKLRKPTKGYYWVLAACHQRMADLTDDAVRLHHDSEALRLRGLSAETPPQNAAELFYLAIDRQWGCADGQEREAFRWPLKDVEESLAMYREMLRLEPSYYNGLFFYSYWLLEADRWEEALGGWNGCLVHHPDDKSALQNRGSTLIEMGHCEEGIADYLRAEQLSRQLVEEQVDEIHRTRAQRYHALGMLGMAQRLLKCDEIALAQQRLEEAKSIHEQLPKLPVPVEGSVVYDQNVLSDLITEVERQLATKLAEQRTSSEPQEPQPPAQPPDAVSDEESDQE